MESYMIIILNLLILCISAHVWQLIKSVIANRGAQTGIVVGVFSFATLFSSAATATTLLIRVAEAAP